jgi:2-C-methyl-D-erythritol 4-phosphate cytidylyltransferase/2-C-methyl-D-erythritol 2,4-cyclodiphosphate synthase
VTRTAVILPAAGIGARLTKQERKAWIPLAGRPLLTYALDTFRAHPAVAECILVVHPGDMERARALIAAGPARVTEKVVLGGPERQASVWHGLQEVSAGTDIVLIHDAARPFLSPALISATIAAAARYGAAVVARPIADTLKRATPQGEVAATLPREAVWGAQTPQGFRLSVALDLFARAHQEGWQGTDDVQLAELAGQRVRLVPGEALNFKITHPEDLTLAERLLAARPPRVGIGYDVHRLVPDRPLVLGGVTIPHPQGLAGHSDADVLTHALMDALLGAAALGDIGLHFPDTDPRYQGADSLALLTEVCARVRAAGFVLVNLDVTLVAQAPKVAPYIAEMRARLAAAAGLPLPHLSVKATTTEGLGFEGERTGMSAYATACLLAPVCGAD